MRIWHVEDDVLDTNTSQGMALFDHILHTHFALSEMDCTERGLLDLGIIPSNFYTMAFQNIQFTAEGSDAYTREQIVCTQRLSARMLQRGLPRCKE